MIELKIEKYCENCPDFEVEVEKIGHQDFFGNVDVDTRITCANAGRCKAIKEHLKRNWDL